MKKIILTFTLSLIILVTFGQNKLYTGLKIGLFSEYFQGPTTVVSKEFNTNSTFSLEDSITYKYDSQNLLSYATVVYPIRYNILEPFNNLGLGINTSPSLSLSLSEYGIGSFNIPAYLSLNFGAGSTSDSKKDWGGYFGVGYEFSKINIINLETKEYGIKDNGRGETFPIKSHWTEPMLIVGFRWWLSGVELIDLSLKYGFGSNIDLPENTKQSSPRTLQITIGWLVNH